MNDVKLTGTLTRSAESHRTARGYPVWEATLAVNGTKFDPESGEHAVDTTFVRLQMFGWAAEWAIRKEFVTGDELFVQGELDQRVVEKKDGSKETKTRVTALFVVPTRRQLTGGVVTGDDDMGAPPPPF